jgi:thiol-disulfide isomerase/thioredoxin
VKRLATVAFLAGVVTLGVAVLLRSGGGAEAHPMQHHAVAGGGYAAPDLHGDTVSLAGLRGNVVVVNLWATWCAPCVRELPSLERLQKRYDDDGLHVLAVNVDRFPPERAAKEIERFMDDLGVDLTVLVDPRGRAEDVFGSLGLPTTIVVGRDGSLVYRRLGEGRWDIPPLRDRVAAALEG